MLLSAHSAQERITQAVVQPPQGCITQADAHHLNKAAPSGQPRRDTQGHCDLATLFSGKDSGLGDDGEFAGLASKTGHRQREAAL